jgi:hypothetical protein
MAFYKCLKGIIMHLDIRNYYEQLVIRYLTESKLEQRYDGDFISDLCCLALNNLPARYIRHDVDMAFYLSTEQREKMNADVVTAVTEALAYLTTRNEQQD